jgi:drug/metabolite transporter (DMT)-like permease
VSLAILLEVPGASLVAWVWLGQVPPVAVIPGAALVLAGLSVVIRAQASSRGAVTEPLSP